MGHCSKNLLTKISPTHLDQLFPQCHQPFGALPLLNNRCDLLFPHLLRKLGRKDQHCGLCTLSVAVLQTRGVPYFPLCWQCWCGFGMFCSALSAPFTCKMREDDCVEEGFSVTGHLLRRVQEGCAICGRSSCVSLQLVHLKHSFHPSGSGVSFNPNEL